MIDYEFLDFNIKEEIKNVKKIIDGSIPNIKEISQNFTKEEEIFFAEEVEKINNFNFGQKRYLILTNKALYNYKKGFFSSSLTLKRRFPYTNILGITIESFYSCNIIIHGKDTEYDYYYKYFPVEKLVGYIAAFYELETSKPLKIVKVSKDTIFKEYVTTKDEKIKDPNFTKFNDDKALLNLLPIYFNKITKKPRKLLKHEERVKACEKIAETKSYKMFDLIKINPSLLEKICVICLKDKDNNEEINIDYTEFHNRAVVKGTYLQELRQYLNQENVKNLRNFIEPEKCPHFYHKYCLNYFEYLMEGKAFYKKCELCKFGITTRNFYLFDFMINNHYMYFHFHYNRLFYDVSINKCLFMAYEDIYTSFIENYLYLIASGEKRKIVEEALTLRHKCVISSPYQEIIEHDEKNNYKFIIKFNNESIKKYQEKLEKANKIYNERHKKDKRNESNSDSDSDRSDHDNYRNDSDDEYNYRKEEKKTDNKRKKVGLFVCINCKRNCIFCRKKLDLMKMKEGNVKAHFDCVKDVKFCILCGNRNNLMNARTICKECRCSKYNYLNNCFFCKKSLNYY